MYEPPLALISVPAGLPVFGPVQLMSYGEVPPVAVPVTVPLELPLHKVEVFNADAVKIAGCEIVNGKV